MDSTTPKVSFIPKGSLVRETAFLERRRPRSAVGFIAGLAFVASVGSYAGLYFYNNTLEKKIAAKTDEINLIQQKFSDAPQIKRAQMFRSRAELARELLDNHTVASPVLDFLSENTVGTILYERFSFEDNINGAVVDLTGEAPNYAVLAYQGDILRKKTKELSSFEIDNISLTEFGTVKFTLALTFMPRHLLYLNNLSRFEDDAFLKDKETNIFGQNTGTSTAFSSGSSSGVASSTEVSKDVIVVDKVAEKKVETGTLNPVIERQSILKSLWSRFKFW